MTDTLIQRLAAYLPRDRAEHMLAGRPLARSGVALIADISGFTPLTEALARDLNPARGAEELTRALNGVFAPLIDDISAHGGSVVKFGGDALIAWFPRHARQRRRTVLRQAVAAAAAMQATIARIGRIETPAGAFTLTMKIGMAYGAVLRMQLGSREYGYEDVIGGATLDRMADAEHHAEPGDIVLDPERIPGPELPPVREWRATFAVLEQPEALGTPRHAPAGPFLPQLAQIDDLRPYVPPDVFDALCDDRDFPAELKPVVSMFVQFLGITFDDAARAEPRLAAYFAAVQATAARYGGRVNRLITGDKGSLLHLIFGAPRAVEELERRAALCALELGRLPGDLDFISGQRIGMALGRAFAGPVGSATRHDYTVMGDAINLSARLMQQAEPGQIVIDPVLAERLTSTFALADLGGVRLKGKAGLVHVWALLAAAEASSAAPPAALVAGRQAELAALRTVVAGVTGGQGQVVVVLGELGMGKSHLLAAIRAESRADWAGANASAYGHPRSGAMLADMLRDLLRLPAEPEQAGAALDTACARLLGSRAAVAARPYLARFLGIPLLPHETAELDAQAGESLRWRIFDLVGDLVVAYAGQAALVLAFDDLQWADPTSLEMLASLLPRCSGTALAIILSARPSLDRRTHPLLQFPGARRLELGPLDDVAAAAIVAHHAPALAPHVVQRLVARGAGNPLFLVELARTAVAGSPDELPDTIQGLLLAQIDRLLADRRSILQVAAVLGDAVNPLLLAEVAGRQVEDALDNLVAGGFLVRAAGGLRFRHGLIRESAYDALLYERRRAYHGSAAAAIEQLYPIQLAERSGELAEHYERAEQPGLAARYHSQAADAARLLYANDEAEAGYRHVLELLARSPADEAAQSRIYLKLAQVKMNAGDYSAAQELYDRAFEQAVAVGVALAPRRDTSPRLFRRGESEPETLDPGRAQTAAALALANELFEGLVSVDSALNVVPAAAWRWHVLDDGRRYRFELRPDASWSDGMPLTAHDFVFAWRRNLDPHGDNPLSEQLYPIAGAQAYHQGDIIDTGAIGVQAVDDHTLDVTLAEPVAHLLYLMADPVAFPLPAHVLQQRGEQWFQPAAFVGNGPFLLEAWQPGRYLELRRNMRYRRHSGNLERARIVFGTPGDDLRRRSLDMLRCEDRPELIQQHHGPVISLQYLDTYMLAFGCATAPFRDVAYRKAFAMAIDQEYLVQHVWRGLQQHATGGVVPPGVPGHSPGIGLPFDPAAARVLLERTHMAVPPIRMACLPGLGATPTFLQAAWHTHLGVEVDIASDLAVDDLLDGLRRGQYQLAIFGWNMEFPDASDILQPLFGGASPLNYVGWQNDTFDALLAQSRQAGRPLERFACYHRADTLLVAEQAVVVPLYHSRTFALLKPGFALADGARVVRGGRLPLDQIVRVTQ